MKRLPGGPGGDPSEDPPDPPEDPQEVPPEDPPEDPLEDPLENLGLDLGSRPGWILGARAPKPKITKMKPLKPLNSGVRVGLGGLGD